MEHEQGIISIGKTLCNRTWHDKYVMAGPQRLLDDELERENKKINHLKYCDCQLAKLKHQASKLENVTGVYMRTTGINTSAFIFFCFLLVMLD